MHARMHKHSQTRGQSPDQIKISQSKDKRSTNQPISNPPIKYTVKSNSITRRSCMHIIRSVNANVKAQSNHTRNEEKAKAHIYSSVKLHHHIYVIGNNLAFSLAPTTNLHCGPLSRPNLDLGFSLDFLIFLSSSHLISPHLIYPSIYLPLLQLQPQPQNQTHTITTTTNNNNDLPQNPNPLPPTPLHNPHLRRPSRNPRSRQRMAIRSRRWNHRLHRPGSRCDCLA